MATRKAQKEVATLKKEVPECFVCLATSRPMFQCQSGHNLCDICTKTLVPPNCPTCSHPLVLIRNLDLERTVSNKVKVPCPNKSFGCVYTLAYKDVEDHLKECIFREMECPLGAVFGKCCWQGTLKDIMEHFKERHSEYCNAKSDADIVLDNIDVKKDDRHFFLVAQGKMLFTITFKLDTLQKMAYWTVQHIGSKNVAKQYIYEIHVISNQDKRRKVVCTERCFNDAIKAENLFRLGKCAAFPLDYLQSQFIKDKKINFRFLIKRLPSQPRGKQLKHKTKTTNEVF